MISLTSFSFLELEDSHRGFNLCTERDEQENLVESHNLVIWPGNTFSSWFQHSPPPTISWLFSIILGNVWAGAVLSAPSFFLLLVFSEIHRSGRCGHLLFLLHSQAFAGRCLFWIPLWLELSFSLIISLPRVCKSPLFYLFIFFWGPSVIMLLRCQHEQEATRKERCSVAQQSLRLRAQERNGGSQGWFGIRDANVEKRLELLLAFQNLGWELGSWKTGSCNLTACHLFGSNCWPGFWAWMNFLSGHGLLSLFSLLPMAVSVL